MILDTSALVAVLFGEPEADSYTRLIHNADRCLISAGTFLERSIVIERQTIAPRGRVVSRLAQIC